jgi:SAM-dependent methyltransferase
VTDRGSTIKDRQRKHWNAVAGGWRAWLEWTRRNFRPLTTWFQQAAGWAPGVRLLDVACGAGYPAIDAAAAVRPGGHVTAIDLSPEMIAVASAQATELGVDAIDFRQMDAEELGFADGTFDAVTNAYGLMFCPEPSQSLREAHRVLAPDGRIALAVWDEPSTSPFFTVIREAASGLFAWPEPAPGEPHPFRLASSAALESLLEAASFSDVRVERVVMTFECASAEEYCRMFGDLAIRSRMAALSAVDTGRFYDAVAHAARPYTSATGRVRLVATSLCASGRKSSSGR